MEKKEEERILSLIGQNPELRVLYTEHLDLKKKLDTLNHKHYLTPEEEVEKKRLQKLKLAGKDRMMAILASQRLPELKQQAESR